MSLSLWGMEFGCQINSSSPLLTPSVSPNKSRLGWGWDMSPLGKENRSPNTWWLLGSGPPDPILWGSHVRMCQAVSTKAQRGIHKKRDAKISQKPLGTQWGLDVEFSSCPAPGPLAPEPEHLSSTWTRAPVQHLNHSHPAKPPNNSVISDPEKL